jgi:hypothetical protein
VACLTAHSSVVLKSNICSYLERAYADRAFLLLIGFAAEVGFFGAAGWMTAFAAAAAKRSCSSRLLARYWRNSRSFTVHSLLMAGAPSTRQQD